MRFTSTLGLLIGLLGAGVARAQAPAGTIEFIENKGQLDVHARYTAPVGPDAQLFAEATGLTYAFHAALPDHHGPAGATPKAALPGGKLAAHALRVGFVNAAFGATLTAETEAPGRRHYLRGADSKQWAADARAWRQLRYHELWPGTDVVLKESADHQLEYDVLLAAGADPAGPRLRYQGAESLRLDPATGDLLVKTSVGQLREHSPQAWQLNPATGQHQAVACAFQLQGEEIGFKLGAYDHGRPLVIDPVVEFASYTGSTVENWGFASTYDASGNLYTAGVVFETGYPVTTGAYQTLFGGSTDIAIMKFNVGTTGPGARAWATYLGGNNLEFPHSLVVNGRGELLMLGTTSSTNYPTTTTAVARTFRGGPAIAPFGENSPFILAGGSDLVLTRLSTSGGRLRASTYLGGTGTDGLLDPTAAAPRLRHNYGDAFRGELAFDPQGNVYVASTTGSANFPGLATGDYRGGSSDGLVTSLDSSLSRVRWTTLVGGSGAEAAFSLQREETGGGLLVAGGTTSANLAGAANGYRAGLAGNVDGFVARLAPGGALGQSTYLGTTAYDQAYFVRSGTGGTVMVMGQTLTATWPGLAPAAYQTAHGQQFIQQLAADLRTAGFATVFGSGRAVTDISPTAFDVDCYGRIMLAGWGGGLDPSGGSTIGLPTTPNALQTNTDGNDFYLMQLSDGAKVLDYASFFGTTADDHVDGGTSRFDAYGVLYQALCACNQGTGSALPIPPGAHYYTPTSGAPQCNNAAFKLNFGAGSTPAGPDLVVVCARAAPVPLGGSPLGGTWTGTGVTGSVAAGYVFTPDSTRLGTHVLTYTNPQASGPCAGTSVRRVQVLYQFSARLTAPMQKFCLVPGGPNPGRVLLTGSPAGGRFGGTALTTTNGQTYFDPVTARRGTYIITYTVGTGPCAATASLPMQVKGIPVYTPRPPRDVCLGEGPIPLNGDPPGGTWTGTAVSGDSLHGYVFTPAVAGVGLHVLLYTFPGDADCPPSHDTLRVRVRLSPPPARVAPDTALCAATARPFRLRPGTPAGGVWSGGGVTGSLATGFTFTPSPAMTGNQTLVYTIPSASPNDCPAQGSRIVHLTTTAPVQLVIADSVLCATEGPQRLLATPPGGTWSGPGVTGTVATGYVFTPSRTLVGRQQLVYVAPPPTDPAICPAAGGLRVRVEPVPFVYLQPLNAISFCLTAPPHGVVLTGIPGGGTFAGPGVVNNRFNPAQAGPGRHTLTYTVTFPDLDCPVTSMQVVEVTLVSAIHLPADTVLCGGQAPFQLRATPAGGTWSGAGVTPTGFFTPSGLPGVSVLSYELPGGCTAQPYRITVPLVPSTVASWVAPACADNLVLPRVLRFQATGYNADLVRWDFGDGSAPATGATVEHTYLAAGRFQPQATLPGGPVGGPCGQQLALAAAEVLGPLIPNIITPNADGLNDTFAPRLGGCPGRLQVYSRWGQQVLDQAEYHNDWGGAGLPAGIYYYLFTQPGTAEKIKGWVEIAR